ncbi:MAG: hypothetical protein GXZ15_04075 [Campylobacter sp.]|nr:hypothetical protein [Campylobacter sp.]
MNKEETIKKFKQALDAQSFTMVRLKNCIKLRRDKEILSVLLKDGEFGKFLYNESYNLKDLLGSTLYDNISRYYEAWKNTYRRIHDALVVDKTARKPKLKKITEKDIDVVVAIYDDLYMINQNLTQQCNTAISRHGALSEDKFK